MAAFIDYDARFLYEADASMLRPIIGLQWADIGLPFLDDEALAYFASTSPKPFDAQNIVIPAAISFLSHAALFHKIFRLSYTAFIYIYWYFSLIISLCKF